MSSHPDETPQLAREVGSSDATEMSWIGDGVLAVGPCPSSALEWDRLADRGFASAVVLRDGLTPTEASARIGTVFELRNDDPRGLIADRIEDAMCAGLPTCVCSDRGLDVASRVARDFAEGTSLDAVERVYADARNLNAGDEFDWVNGHADFGGERGNSRIRMLIGTLAHPNARTLLNAADTLAEIMDHAGHGCFGREKLELLERVQPAVEHIVTRLNPGQLRQYRSIFRTLDSAVSLSQVMPRWMEG